MKKILAGTALTLATVCGLGAFVGCNDEATAQKQDEKKIMQLSLNPAVEFVLDENDVVVSASATNEEGNLILSAQAFTGKSAVEAAELFVQVSEETGFLVKGSVKSGENEIKVAFSGDTEEAKKLYDSVKNEIQTYVTEKGLTAKVEQAQAIAKDEIEKLVAECAPHLTESEIEAMAYEELLQVLLASRRETAEMYSQELKKAYYSAKAFAIEQAELETLKTHLSEIEKIAYTMAYTGYSNAVSAIEQTRLTLLVNENSPYQTALAQFREAKAQYLAYRNAVANEEPTEEINSKLAQYDAFLENAETALNKAGTDANNALDSARAQLKVAYDALIKIFDEASVKANTYVDEISANTKTATEVFFTQFETQFAQVKENAKKDWSAMRDKMQKTEE